MHEHTYIYAHTHTCTLCSEFVAGMLKSNKHLYNVYICTCTSAQNTCSKVHESLTAKKMHIYIFIHTYAYAYIYRQTRMRIDDTAPHANTSLLRLTIYAQICIHIHIHMYIHAYVYVEIYTSIYVHTYMFVHIHTYTYIHTHIRHVHMHTRKPAWNDGVAATAPDLKSGSSTLLPVRCNPEGSHLPWPRPNCSFSRNDRGTTDKRRTTSTNRSSSHHHDSAPPRLNLLICTGAGPIHLIHGCSVRGHGDVPLLPFSDCDKIWKFI